MATVTPKMPRATGNAERLFYTSYMFAIFAAVLVGFAPSFFLRGVVPPFRPLKPLHPIVLVHGAITASWILLFPLQAWLISAGKRALHIRIGNWGFALGVAMTASAYVLAVGLYHEPPPPGLTPTLNVTLAFSDFLTLLVLLPLAWRWRKNGQMHKRIMIIIACLLGGAAIFRLPFGDRTTVGGLVVVHLWLYATLLPLWIWDFRTLGRLHRATMIGSAIVAIDMFGRLLIAQTPAWTAFVAAFPGFGWPTA
jgi:hypothetical protein